MPSIMMGALAGAGNALGEIATARIASDMEGERDMRRAGLERENYALKSGIDAKRAEALEIFKEERRQAPLQRISDKAKGYNGQDIPLEAAPVTSLSGINEGGKKFGLQGDLKVLRAALDKEPDSQNKTEAIAQLEKQIATDTKTQQGIVSGKTRKRTSEEALALAVDDAKGNDLNAYAAYEAQIGKPLRDDRRIDGNEKRDDARAVTSARESDRKAQSDALRFESEFKRIDILSGTLEESRRKTDAWISNESQKRDNDTLKLEAKENPKASSPERLYSIVNAMNTTIKNLDDGSKGRTPEEKAEWQRQKDTAVRVRDRASGLLDANLSDRGAPASEAKPLAPAAAAPKPAPAPAATTSATGLSTPKTQAEFNALASGAKYINPSDGKTYQKK